METYRIEIDKGTKVGKAFFKYDRNFLNDRKGVEIIEGHTQAD
jgi:hypothetical protein